MKHEVVKKSAVLSRFCVVFTTRVTVLHWMYRLELKASVVCLIEDENFFIFRSISEVILKIHNMKIRVKVYSNQDKFVSHIQTPSRS